FRHPNQRVLVYLRNFEATQVLCIYNLSRRPQAVELDLKEFNGFTPVEATTDEAFPSIGELPYFLTLGEHAWFWFRLDPPAAPKADGTA
ncbi:MAG: alpha-glucosidase C-terminal domain-containing protein, partial [Thermoplasmata archaeon]